jgi:hypothetical protein
LTPFNSQLPSSPLGLDALTLANPQSQNTTEFPHPVGPPFPSCPSNAFRDSAPPIKLAGPPPYAPVLAQTHRHSVSFLTTSLVPPTSHVFSSTTKQRGAASAAAAAAAAGCAERRQLFCYPFARLRLCSRPLLAIVTASDYATAGCNSFVSGCAADNRSVLPDRLASLRRGSLPSSPYAVS